MVSLALRRNHPLKSTKTPEEGYHLMDDMTDKAISWIGQQKALMPDKPFFMYFAPGCDPRSASCSGRMGGQVQGQVRPGLGQAPRRDIRAAIGARRHPDGLPTYRTPQGNPGLGRHGSRAEAGTHPPDGGLCRVSWNIADHHVGRLLDHAGDAQASRQHAGLLHHRRQRCLGEGTLKAPSTR